MGDFGEPKKVDAPIDVVLFAGWMLGFRPIEFDDAVRLNMQHKGMWQVNLNL